MASQGTSLRFMVEVSADQAKEALKAMTVAFNEAGVKAKASLSGIGGAAKQSASSLEQLKTSTGRARETALFFTQSLSEFGPAGRTAQLAIGGITGAIIGGGGVLLALSAAQVAVRLLVDYWREDAKAAEEAAAAHKKAAEDKERYNRALSKDANEHLATLRSMRARFNELSEAEKANAVVREINALAVQAQEGPFKRMLELRLGEARTIAADIAAKEKDTAAQEKNNKARAVSLDLQEKAAKVGQAALDARARASEREAAATQAAEERAAKEGQAALDARARKYEKEQADEDKALKARTDQYVQYGQAVGTVLGELATGQLTLGQAFQQVGQMIIQTVVKQAIASVTAHAAGAAAGAAESQSAIPIIGPVLAISAMGAVLSQVLGLLGNLPSAAGGWMVPHDSLAMVHENERILPARYSEGLDRLVAGGGTGNVTVNISATDARGVRRLFLDNAGALAEAIGRAVRDGRSFA